MPTACLVAIVLAGCGSSEPAPAPQPPVEHSEQSTSRPALPPDGRMFGFSDQTFTYTGGPERDLDQGITADREAADALAAGANAHRVTLAWWPLERRPGQVDEQYVGRVQAFAQRIESTGGKVLITLGVPPPWAAAAPNRANSAPKRDAATIAAFAKYAAFVAKAFPNAAGIETWNEPNSRYFWAPTAPDAGWYAQLHKAAAKAIRDVNPKMTVVVGGLLTGARGDRSVVAPSKYLRDMYAKGLHPSDYDVLAIHPYPPQRSGDRAGAVRAALEDFRSGYADRDRDARVWVTETGATTTGSDALPPNEQAVAVNDVVDTLFGAGVEAVFLHTLYDTKRHGAGDREKGFGMLSGGKPKPVFCTLRQRARDPGPFTGGC
jgi:hypothetical protein